VAARELTGGTAAKSTGLRNLLTKGLAQDQIWCEIVALACELLASTQMLALDRTPATETRNGSASRLKTWARLGLTTGRPEALESMHMEPGGANGRSEVSLAPPHMNFS
jgi:hypothetical protein